MDLQSCRNFVRAQLEMDDEELPDSLVDPYLKDAFDRTVARSNRWPYYETTWPLSKVSGQVAVALPSDINLPGIMSVLSVKDGYRLVAINHENAEDAFAPNASLTMGVPIYYSIWANQLWLWPTVATDASYDMQVRGYRQPAFPTAASTQIDLDPRLHMALCYYAIALTYAQQEDEVLEGTNMARWDRDVVNAMASMLEPVHHRPLVLHGGAPVGGVPGYYVNLPTTGP